MKRMYLCMWMYKEEINTNMSPLQDWIFENDTHPVFYDFEFMETINPEVDLEDGKPIKYVCIHIITANQTFFDWLDINAPYDSFLRIPKMDLSVSINELWPTFIDRVDSYSIAVNESFSWEEFKTVEEFVHYLIKISCPSMNLENLDLKEFND